MEIRTLSVVNWHVSIRLVHETATVADFYKHSLEVEHVGNSGNQVEMPAIADKNAWKSVLLYAQ